MNTADKIREIEKKHHFQSDWFEEALQEMAEWKDEQQAKEKQQWIAWLEKQGKPISRFKVGDKVLWKYDKSVVRTITKVSDCGTYWIECKGCSSGWWSEQELEPCVNKDEQKPTQSPMTKLEEKLSSLVVAAVHTYCEKNLLDTPHFVGLILGDNMAKEWSKEILTLAEEELRKIEIISHCNVTKCGCLEVTDMLEWLEELEKQGKRNNIVEQLTAFAQHLNKRGAFREDLCMDFEHEAQSFIEIQNNEEL